MKKKIIKINGLNHQIYTWGKSSLPKLFFFHGWMDTGASFEFCAKHLQKKFHCIAIDFRGFAKSQHTKNELGYFFYEYVADIHDLFLKMAPNEKIKAIGHSMGGNVLSIYAGTFVDNITHFINIEGFGLYEMPASMGPDRLQSWINGRGKTYFNVYPKVKDVVNRLQKTNPNFPTHRAKFVVPYITKKVKGGFKFNSDPKHKWTSPYLFHLENIYAFWKQIKAKTLLITAENTEMGSWIKNVDDVHKELQERLDYFPRESKRIQIKNCGHMIHFEKPEELAQEILDFL